MNIKIWGCRGSLPTPGSDKVTYGGNTSCVEVTERNTCIILDGGSGIQHLGEALPPNIHKIHILLTHLHLDHIIGLGFFSPFYNSKMEIHIWGPVASNESLENRLRRYFSPPIFPVRLNELPCKVEIREITENEFSIDDFRISAEYICHPGPTVGYRLQLGKKVVAYIPDHEPALGSSNFPNEPEWTSGYNLAKGADILIHDSQYKTSEYPNHVGWGHCSMQDAIDFGILAGVKKMLFFHHDPTHTDDQLRQLYAESIYNRKLNFGVELAREGKSYSLHS